MCFGFSDADRIPEWLSLAKISQNYGLIVGFEDNSFRGQKSSKSTFSCLLKSFIPTGGMDKSILKFQNTKDYKIHSGIVEFKDFQFHWSYAYLIWHFQ